MEVQSPAKFGKFTLDVFPHLSASQFDQRICAWRRMRASIWGSRYVLLGMYSSSSVALPNISSPKSFKLSDALWSTPKHVLKISQFRSYFPRAIKKFRGKLMPLGAERISMSARDGVPAPEATMAY